MEEEETKKKAKSSKISKKLISISKISVSYNTETIILRKLQIDKETSGNNLLN
jgi:hypothetical protein